MTFQPVPYKVQVYETLRKLYNHNLLYHTTSTIVTKMEQPYHRTYRALKALEKAGVIQSKTKTGCALHWRPTMLASATYGTLLKNYRRAHDYISAQTIGIQLNTNDRTIRDQLTNLEAAGIVQRSGSRGGWRPVRQPQPPATQQFIDTLHTLYDKHQTTVPTKSIAQMLQVDTSHVRRHLAIAHANGIIERAGYHSGWLPITA